MSENNFWISLIFFFVALLYAAVGQAGASGYLAAMGLFSFPPEAMKVTALSLNLFVAGIGTWLFWRKGTLSWRDFYPFGVLGIPFSLIGGAVHLPSTIYYPVIGAILCLASLQMAWSIHRTNPKLDEAIQHPPFFFALLTGAIIGFISGTTGTGGGVFLAPILLAMHWVGMRKAAGVTAAYNLLNSAAALIGAYLIQGTLPSALPIWLFAVGLGGAIGAFLGSHYLPEKVLRYVLMLILAISGIKLALF